MDITKSSTELISSFTIIIPVIHSLEDAEKCIASLDNIDYPKDCFQVVLVDCHVLSGVQNFFKEKIHKYGFNLNVLSLPEHPEAPKSWLIESRINEARNYAVQKIPGECYVFTEDDCAFEPDWLYKIESALTKEVGAIGGPDLLPEGMDWFPQALDCLLNSYLGTAGMRRGDGRQKDQYYPRKENMAIPSRILDRVGNFPEEMPIGGKLEMARRIVDAGFEIRFLADNPVWHRRVTTFRNFVRLTSYMASMKVKLMRRQQKFTRSLHFYVFMATIASIIIGLFSLINNNARILLVVMIGIYLVSLIINVFLSAIRTRSLSVGMGVLLLIPAHHISLIVGIIKGVFTRIKTC